MGEEADVDTQPLANLASQWLIAGRYRVLDRLGTGGTAEVFRAHDDVLRRDVAVKIFRTAFVDDPDGHGAERRELELQALARLSHPNLITLYDGSLTSDGPPYLVLELVRGADLATRLRDGPLPEPEARVIGAQVADALAYAHGQGLVHRDVKPANVLLGNDGPDGVRARLSDFGTVRLIDAARMTAGDLTVGTASYLAPEQALGADVGPEADVYALGLVLVEALTGARCFDGPMHEVLAARLTCTPEIPDDLPDPWPTLLAAMTAADPQARPTAAEVAASLRTGVAPAAPLAPPPLTDVPAEHRRGWGAWLALAGVAVIGMLLGAAFIFRGGSAQPPADDPPVQPGTQSAVPSQRHQPSKTAVVGNELTTSAQPTPSKSRHTSAAASRTPATSRVVAPRASATPTSSAAPSSPSPAPSTSQTTSSTSPSTSPSASPTSSTTTQAGEATP